MLALVAVFAIFPLFPFPIEPQRKLPLLEEMKGFHGEAMRREEEFMRLLLEKRQSLSRADQLFILRLLDQSRAFYETMKKHKEPAKPSKADLRKTLEGVVREILAEKLKRPPTNDEVQELVEKFPGLHPDK